MMMSLRDPASARLARLGRALMAGAAAAALAGVAALGACGDKGPTDNNNKPPIDSTVAEPSVEARALWLSRYDFSTQAQLKALIDSAAAANFNIIYFQARGNGDALYKPGLEPWYRGLTGTLGQDPGWDPLQVAITEAHAKGLELHAWINVATAWSTANALTESTPRHPLLEHPDWAFRDTLTYAIKADGSYQLFAPGAPGYRTWVARVAADIVRRYGVDGIHLDYIRYPYPDWADSASVAGWKAGGKTGTYPDYKRAMIADIVKQVYDSMKVVRPAARLSAATWGVYTQTSTTATWSPLPATGFDGRLQDPRDWAQKGIIDAIVPMVYWPITTVYGQRLDFAYLSDDHAKANVNGRHTYIGLDIENDLPGSEGAAMVKEINRARYAGAIGVSVFSAQIMRNNNWWHVLPATVFKKKATVPGMSWKAAL